MIALLLLIAAAPAEEVLARGGELDGPPAQTTVTEGDELVAFGYSEVPPNPGCRRRSRSPTPTRAPSW